MTEADSIRWWQRVITTEGCWHWAGAISRLGYSIMKLHGRSVSAHRFGYQMLRGPIPDGMELDHLCRNRACVNPAHLEPVTHRENCRRGTNNHGGVCKNGHPFDGMRDGKLKFCKTCNRVYQREWKRKKHGYRPQK